MGQSPPSTTINEDGIGLPFIQGNAEFGTRNPSPLKFCTDPPKQAAPGAILLSVRAPVGALNIAHERLCIGRGLAAITAAGVDSGFLWHALAREIPNLTRVSQGSTFAAVNRTDLNALEFSIPSPREQRKIAAILSSVDDAIEKTQAVVDQVQVLKRGVMQELFTRGLPERHTQFKKTEIGDTRRLDGHDSRGCCHGRRRRNAVKKPTDLLERRCSLGDADRHYQTQRANHRGDGIDDHRRGVGKILRYASASQVAVDDDTGNDRSVCNQSGGDGNESRFSEPCT